MSKADLFITLYKGYQEGPFAPHKVYRRLNLEWAFLPGDSDPIQVGRTRDENGEWRDDCFNVYRRNIFFSTNNNVIIECHEVCDPEEFDHLCECLERDQFILFVDNMVVK